MPDQLSWLPGLVVVLFLVARACISLRQILQELLTICRIVRRIRGCVRAVSHRHERVEQSSPGHARRIRSQRSNTTDDNEL
jgi:hypothetical protein